MRFCEWQDKESVILRASLVARKYSLFDPLGERTSDAAWVVAFFNSCGLLAGGSFVRQC